MRMSATMTTLGVVIMLRPPDTDAKKLDAASGVESTLTRLSWIALAASAELVAILAVSTIEPGETDITTADFGTLA